MQRRCDRIDNGLRSRQSNRLVHQLPSLITGKIEINPNIGKMLQSRDIYVIERSTTAMGHLRTQPAADN